MVPASRDRCQDFEETDPFDQNPGLPEDETSRRRDPDEVTHRRCGGGSSYDSRPCAHQRVSHRRPGRGHSSHLVQTLSRRGVALSRLLQPMDVPPATTLSGEVGRAARSAEATSRRSDRDLSLLPRGRGHDRARAARCRLGAFAAGRSTPRRRTDMARYSPATVSQPSSKDTASNRGSCRSVLHLAVVVYGPGAVGPVRGLFDGRPGAPCRGRRRTRQQLRG
jgi:hypothetical protein